ncbi:hypothetical protein MEQU1_000723 [Malassezia equina]|uniref:Major facilitator superfamily (MFS) profile domain-containing protein n=1 Tax=Malassezia equina TaxID=1381935 RepID=A0AAF0ECD2_9BASI|nr:hypothetical protein MEQU1_000723 [Malassezia equina]
MSTVDTPPKKPFGELDTYAFEKDAKISQSLQSISSDTDGVGTKVEVEVRRSNPLLGLTAEQIEQDVQEFVSTKGLGEYHDVFVKGAFCAQAQASGDYNSISILTEEDRQVLATEKEHKWRQPFVLYWLAICCSVAAAIQGADESVINGALLFFPNQFGLYTDYCSYFQAGPDGECNGPLLPEFAHTGWTRADVTDEISKNNWLIGLVSSAPYICCAFLGCWLTQPMNALVGRRGTIFIASFLSFATCIWQAVTNNWWHLFISRFFLGIGIGPKSATVPVYTAESAPPLIRGALVMQYQTWTAFGFMLGNAAGLALYRVQDTTNITGLNWRLMMGSAAIPALFVMAQVYFCPESPRWLMKRGRYRQAMNSFLRIRSDSLLAARDMYFAHCLIEEERRLEAGRTRIGLLQLFTIPRNLRATWASSIVMFGQQFCGVNVIAYFSSSIIKEVGGASDLDSLLGSWGFGMICFLSAIPAWYTIDTFGRRNLLLFTTPFLALFLLVTGFAFWIDASKKNARLGVVLLGIFAFGSFYGPGFGPVPLTYGAEVFPIHVREIGMGFSTAVFWFFNAILGITWFRLEQAFKPQGAFGWYAAWCAILWLLVFLFLPETKALTLEELDIVFNVPTTKHASYQVRQIPYFIRRYIFRQKLRQGQVRKLDDALCKV